MKRLIAFCCSLSLALVLLACTKDGHKIPQKSIQKSELLSDLRALNDSIISNNLGTKSCRGYFVASMDAVGVFNGYHDGGSVGFWVGFALGNPAAGKVIGSAVGSLLYGAAYSYLAYAGTSSCGMLSADDLYNKTVASIIASGKLDQIVFSDYQVANPEKHYSILPDEKKMDLSIEVPVKFSDAEYVANSHNETLKNMLDGSGNTLMTKSSVCDNPAFDILSDENFKNKFKEDITKLFENDILYKTQCTTKTEEIVDLYLQVFELTADDVDATINIANRYIDLIEQSDELADDERMAVYSCLSTSVYSTDFWIEYIHDTDEELRYETTE